MAKKKPNLKYVLCLSNDEYPVSLEAWKVYQILPDKVAKARGLVRVIDESGEDYLYPQSLFVSIRLPKLATEIFAGAS
jgi:hypothetical protein